MWATLMYTVIYGMVWAVTGSQRKFCYRVSAAWRGKDRMEVVLPTECSDVKQPRKMKSPSGAGRGDIKEKQKLNEQKQRKKGKEKIEGRETQTAS